MQCRNREGVGVTKGQLATNALTLALNAVADGDRILILPLGDIAGRDGRAWRMTREDADALVARIADDGLEIVLDVGHGTYMGPPHDAAAGWLSAFQAEAAGITAQVNFTEYGQELVDTRKYRYLSPAFLHDGPVIQMLESVGLVNTPNLTGLTAMNRQGGTPEGGDMSTETTLATAQARIAELEAKVAAGQAALNTKEGALATAVKERDEALLALNKLQGEVAQRDAAAAEAAVCAMVDKAIADGKLAPAQKDSALALGKNNKEALAKLIETSALNLKGQLGGEQGNAPKDGGGAGLDADELAMCRTMGIKPEEFQKTKAARAAAGA